MSLYGIPVVRSKWLPPDTALLVGRSDFAHLYWEMEWFGLTGQFWRRTADVSTLRWKFDATPRVRR